METAPNICVGVSQVNRSLRCCYNEKATEHLTETSSGPKWKRMNNLILLSIPAEGRGFGEDPENGTESSEELEPCTRNHGTPSGIRGSFETPLSILASTRPRRSVSNVTAY